MLTAIQTLGSWEAFLLAVVIAGVIQMALGFLRAGVIGYYFPSSVIKGMLAGIGLTIILKQLPHAVGYDADAEGNLAFSNTAGGDNTVSAIGHMFGLIEPGALLVALLSLAVLVTWEQPVIKRLKASLWIQGPLVAVALGIVLNEVFTSMAPGLAIGASHLVQMPEVTGLSGLASLLSFPDFTSSATRPSTPRPSRWPWSPASRRCCAWKRPTSSTPRSGSRRPTANSRRRASATSSPA